MKTRMHLFLIVGILALPGLACGLGAPATPTAVPEAALPEPTATAEGVATAAPTYTLPVPTATSTPTADGQVTANILNVRSGPGLEHPILGQLPEGTLLTVQATNAERTWLQITAGDQAGWVSVEYVDLAIPLDSIPVADGGLPTGSPVPTGEATASGEQGQGPTASAEELAYLSEIQVIEEGYAETMDAFMELGTEIQQNPLLAFDGPWKEKVRTHIETVDALYQRVVALDPPARYQSAHAQLVEASEHFRRAGQLVSEGLDELNPSKLTDAGQEVQLGIQAAERAAAEFDKLWERAD